MKKKIKIPKNMTEDEVMQTLNNVANRLAYRFKFGYHSIDDMKQQARLFAWEGLIKYDGVRPLENFLWTHVRNRLFNFKRDKYSRPNQPCDECGAKIKGDFCRKFLEKTNCKYYSRWLKRNISKRNIINPIDITNINDNNENNMKTFQYNDILLEHKEILDIINKELSPSLRSLFIRLQYNGKLTKIQREKIQMAVQEVLKTHGYV